MGERSVEHGSFSIERRYDVPPATVFEAWADAGAKARWFSETEEWVAGPLELDFRVGGREVHRSGPEGGPVHTYRAIYWDIVANQRIVYTYEMLRDETRVSVSLATIELQADDGRTTLLVLTEHGAFFDGLVSPTGREQGWGSLLDALDRALQGDE
jgi:uncharacterized protein YndB with AHSA1/START domain